MNALAGFALGLGIFFVGMQLVAEHLRQLSGPSFRALVTRFTSSPWAGSVLGLAMGAMMQSATGVTFILVNMVASGLIVADAALPVIIWTNVGLTLLAFIVTFDIHPLVAWGVGISGVAASLVRHRTRRQVASVLVGIGLLLFGLQTMGASAGPLQHAEWLTALVERMAAMLPLAFLVGFALAAVLQSNSGAALLIMTLAQGDVLGLEPAALLIYGTNLGAIPLRFLLSSGMRGAAVQLVRFEDLFCVLSGVLMVTLFYVEHLAGVPLVLAAAKRMSATTSLQLACVFLLSNLLPALLMSPWRRRCLTVVEHLWPAGPEAEAAEPKFLTERSLDDPTTAVDLIPRELARLLANLQASAHDNREDDVSAILQDQRDADFAMLLERIEQYTTQLTLAPVGRTAAEHLNLAREATSIIGYLGESFTQLRNSLVDLRRFPVTNQVRSQVLTALDALFGAAVEAVDARQPAAIARLREQSRRHSELVQQTRQSCAAGSAADELGDTAVAQRTTVLKVMGDFELVTWIVHRLSKLLEQLAADAAPKNPPAK